MGFQTVYILRFEDATEVFTESESGVLDLMSRLSPDTDSVRVAMSAAGTGAISEEILVDAEYFDAVVYQTPELRPREFRYTRIRRDEPGDSDPEIADFFVRYPVLRRLVSQGDFISAARILRRSRKIQPFVPLVRHLFRDSLFMIFAVEYLHRSYGMRGTGLFDPEDGAVQIVDERVVPDRHEDGTARLASYCRIAVTSRTTGAFTEECTDKVPDYLSSHEAGLILPVVGTFARPAARDISDEISSLIASARHDSMIRGDTGAGEHLEAYLRSIQVEIRPEPKNIHDTNALAVWVKMPPILTTIDVDAFRHVGYLKRQIAAIVAPKLAQGLSVSASLARVTDGEMDVRVVARK